MPLKLRPLIVILLSGLLLTPQAIPAEASPNNLHIPGDLKMLAPGEPESQQIAFADFAHRISVDFPDFYSDAAWESPRTIEPTVFMTNNTPMSIRNALAKSKYRVEFSDSFNMKQREIATIEAYELVLGHAGVIDATAHAEASSGTVHITAHIDDMATVAPDLRDQLTRRATQENSLKVEITTTASNLGSVQYIGGEPYTGAGDPTSNRSLNCTGGFVVKDARGRTGIVTARHCGPPRGSYDGATLEYAATLPKNQGDLLWAYSTSGTPKPLFRGSATMIYHATGVIYPTEGQELCKYGRTTSWGCSKHWKNGVCANGYCGLSAATENITASGDSGGPWFFHGRAAGITHGYTTMLLRQRSLYTHIGALERFSGNVKIYR